MNTSLELMYRFIYNHAQVNDPYPINLIDMLSKSVVATKNMIEKINNDNITS
jgi:hypothetical protein